VDCAVEIAPCCAAGLADFPRRCRRFLKTLADFFETLADSEIGQ